MSDRSEKYEADDPLFDDKHGILKNKLGLINEQELELVENEALIRVYDQAAMHYRASHQFTMQDVCRLHEMFLGDIFEWAGEYRRVDISSPDIRWCHAKFIEKEMAKFNDLLKRLTPFSPDWSRDEILTKLAEIHGEFIVIHPFRDGNGRTGRMFSNLLLMQAETPPFQMAGFDSKGIREEYFEAVQEVWRKADYKKLIRLFDQLVPQS